MRRQLHLVRRKEDMMTVTVLSRLLEDAIAGRVIGIAYVALHHRHEYSADIVGSALQSPLLSRGICRALEDAVAEAHKKTK